MIKMILGLLFSIGMLILSIIKRRKVKQFIFYLQTIIIIFAIILFGGQIIGG